MDCIWLSSISDNDRLVIDAGKSCANFFVPLPTKLYDTSLEFEIYPKERKVLHVKTLTGKRDRPDVCIYRPFSTPSIFIKILGKMIYGKLSNYFPKYRIYKKHGFLRGRSVLTNLYVYHEDLSIQ